MGYLPGSWAQFVPKCLIQKRIIFTSPCVIANDWRRSRVLACERDRAKLFRTRVVVVVAAVAKDVV